MIRAPTTIAWASAGALTFSVAMPALANPGSAFVFANNQTAEQYEPTKSYARSTTGQRIEIQRKRTGRYEVMFAGAAKQANGGNVQVSAYGGGAEHCKVGSWTPSGDDMRVRVSCFLGTKPADARFSLLFTPSAVGGRQARAAARFAWAGRPSAAQYAADTNYTQNAQAAVQIERRGSGQYVVRFEGVSPKEATGGNVQVTAYGAGAAHCKVQRWAPRNARMDVNVRCYRGTDPADSAFSILFTPGAVGPTVIPRRLPPAERAPTLQVRFIGNTPYAGRTAGAGRMYKDGCRSNEAIVGVSASLGGGISALQVRCGRLSLSADKRSVEVVPTRSLDFRPRRRGRASTARCPANQVVTGFAGRSGASVQQLKLHCASLKVNDQGDVNIRATLPVSAVGASGGRRFPPRMCPGGGVATTGLIRAGDAVNAFALGCGRFKFAQD